MAIPTTPLFPDPTEQYLRTFSLIVSNAAGNGLDLSALRVKFSVKRTSLETPNAADIRIYNLSHETAIKVRSEYKTVTLQAGYVGNTGVIFKGNIKQVILGRESATDNFVDIIAGDGALGYNYAIVNQSLSAAAGGVSQNDQIKAIGPSMAALGVSIGVNSGVASIPKLPRGKTIHGSAKNQLRRIAQTNQCDWSIQNNQVIMIPKNSYLPGTAVLITAATGMIGTPNQTNEGVNVRCFINPKIQIAGRVQLDNATIARVRIDLTVRPNSTTNTAAPLASNGTYVAIAIEQTGDTRGVEWYSTLICNYIDNNTVNIGAVNI
jgi:hypothetical protein